MAPKPIPAFIKILQLKLLEDFGIEFDGILVNYYPDGNSSMGYHADPIGEKWTNDFIILSLGATREFIFRNQEVKEEKLDMNLKMEI